MPHENDRGHYSPGASEASDAAVTVTQIDEKITDSGPLPYWLVNVPHDKWPSECPEFLRNISEKNIWVLSTPDELYRRQDWETVKRIKASNQLDLFMRVPTDLRKYLEYTTKIKAAYGSVMDFIVKERLHWTGNLEPKGKAYFENPDDYKILYNDWPYGVEKDIIHLVVWTKFELEDDPATDDLTPRARKEIDDFVEKTFRSKMPPGQVIWFKNWKSLKSVRAIEHFHVMLNKPDMEFVREITQGDVPLVEKVL